MKAVVKIYSSSTSRQHINTLMLCGPGSGKFDNHEKYRWVSFPWGTIGDEEFKTKEEALHWLDTRNIPYEEMRGCMMTLVKPNGDYTAASAPFSWRYDV